MFAEQKDPRMKISYFLWNVGGGRTPTSVKVIISFPDPAGLNLTPLKPHAGHGGPVLPPAAQSNGSSPSAICLSSLKLLRVLSLSKIFRGRELLTSHTATTPSWLATANLVPSLEKAVENDPVREE